jgi:rare lipoprotein A
MKMKFMTTVLLLLSVVFVHAQSIGGAGVIKDSFHELKMANGEKYDKNTFVAAHKSIEFGKKVKITNLENNKFAIAVISDRGPYDNSRIIDVSRAVANELEMTDNKTARVRVEIISGGTPVATTAPASTTTEKKETPTKPAASENTEKKPVPKKPAVNINKAETKTGLFKVDVFEMPKKGFGVQIGSFSSFDVLLQQVAMLKGKGFQDVLIAVNEVDGKTTYKIILGNYPEQAQATSYKNNLKKKFSISGFVVNFEEL